MEPRGCSAMKAGIEEGVNGTPAFFLNGMQIQVENYQDLPVLIERAVVEFATTKGQRL